MTKAQLFLKNRDAIIKAVEEGTDFLEWNQAVIKVSGKKDPVIGKPYISGHDKGIIFGITTEDQGEVEIYSPDFNNLTNAYIDFVILR